MLFTRQVTLSPVHQMCCNISYDFSYLSHLEPLLQVQGSTLEGKSPWIIHVQCYDMKFT